MNTTIQNWDDIKGDFSDADLLLGNGFSCNLWGKFSYPSLFDKAFSPASDLASQRVNKLSTAFDSSKNFEDLLSKLAIADKVAETLDSTTDKYKDDYDFIRTKLFATINEVHPEHGIIIGKLENIKNHLEGHNAIYTTNYDLLLYWAIISIDNWKNKFRDFFWQSDSSFDANDTTILGKKIPLYFLHGGLHIYKQDGRLCKRTGGRENILPTANCDTENPQIPVFVAEDSHKNKLDYIDKSNYLRFCYDNLRARKKPLVIIGHSLSVQDQHIVDAITSNQEQKIAISTYGNDSQQESQRRKFGAKLTGIKEDNLSYFKSSTHPLLK